MNTVTLPLWAYIGLIAYSLIFSGLFVAALAAFERERRDRDGLELSLRAVADHCFSQYKAVREELNRLEARQVADLATPGPLHVIPGHDPESTQNPRHSGLDPESTQNPLHSGLDPESTLFSDYSPRDYGREYRRLADARPAAHPWRWSPKIIKEFKK